MLQNPQRFLDQTASILKHELHRLLVDGIKYERRPGGGPDAAWELLLFVKLPGWFVIDTLVGKYNPDWAILKHDGTALYLVRETKGTRDFLELRPQISERAMQRLVHRVFVHPKRLRNFGNGFFADPPPIENVPIPRSELVQRSASCASGPSSGSPNGPVPSSPPPGRPETTTRRAHGVLR